MQTLSIRTILVCLAGLWVFALVVICMNGSSQKVERELHNLRIDAEDDEPQTPAEPPVYRFSDPLLAYKILSQLEVLPDHDEKILKRTPFLNLKVDHEYCDKHRRYITEYPESIFREINYISDARPSFLTRQILGPMGFDIMPRIGGHMPKTETTLFDIKPEANVFFTGVRLYGEKKVGRHFSCITQTSNHVQGKQVLSSKNELAEQVKEYAKKYTNRPECFNVNNFYPSSYLLYRKNECKAFFKAFNSAEYDALKAERGIVYIKKNAIDNLHGGKGVEPVQQDQERELKTLYKNGALCGEINEKYVLQSYIHNPLLLNGRKFDFRIYLMLASVNPLIAHYHDGFLRVSLMPYDTSTNDKKALLTNLGLNYQIYGDAKGGAHFQGMDEEQLKNAQQWSYQRLHTYLMEQGVISDPNWLDNYLRPSIKRALAHLLRFALIEMNEHSSLFQIYGVDFMLDTDLNLWFIEANSKPGFGEYSQSMEKFIMKMLSDHVEVAVSLMRSRMKRIVNYVNSLIEEQAYDYVGKNQIMVKDLEHRRMVFQQISKNAFDDEYPLSPNNGFSKILDENYKGVERYQGLIEKECL